MVSMSTWYFPHITHSKIAFRLCKFFSYLIWQMASVVRKTIGFPAKNSTSNQQSNSCNDHETNEFLEEGAEKSMHFALLYLFDWCHVVQNKYCFCYLSENGYNYYRWLVEP